jgi:hypothetical protein
MDLNQTIFAGTAIACFTYLLKQFLDYFFLSRWIEHDRLRGNAMERAIFLSHFLHSLPSNPKDEIMSVWIAETQEVRRLAGSFLAFHKKRHFLLCFMTTQEKVKATAIALLGLSQCTRSSDAERAKEYAREVIRIFNGENFNPDYK